MRASDNSKVVFRLTCWTLLALTSCGADEWDTLAADNERRTYNGTGEWISNRR